MRINAREKVEEAERLKYRSQLDDKADKRNANKREFYKDLSRFQVWCNEQPNVREDIDVLEVKYLRPASATTPCSQVCSMLLNRNTKWRSTNCGFLLWEVSGSICIAIPKTNVFANYKRVIQRCQSWNNKFWRSSIYTVFSLLHGWWIHKSL